LDSIALGLALKAALCIFAWVGRILAIDYGLKRTGLAWTDVGQRVALPLAGVPTQEVWAQLEALVPEVSLVLVGYPRSLKGEPTEMTAAVEAFLREFTRRYPHLPVKRVEERFSSQGAAVLLRQEPLRLRRQKAYHDRTAAWLLLHTYLLGREKL